MSSSKKNIPLRFKFSLRSLILAASVWCILLGHWTYVKKKHQAAFQHLKSREVGLPVSLEEPFGSNFLYINNAEVPPNGYFSRWFVSLFCIEGAGRAYVVNSELELKDWSMFGDLVGLRVIDISDSDFDSTAIEKLKGCKSLRHLILMFCKLDADYVQALSELSQLETLDLYDMDLPCSDITLLRRALPDCTVKSNCPD